MEKINFQNATLKTQAHIIIDGQTYNVVDAEYEGGTNLDAETLNYAFQLMHPVGSIYMTTIETNPSEIFGFGEWVLWGAGKVPVGVDTTQTEFDTVEKTGGEKTHTLTIEEMPRHAHPLYDVAGGSIQFPAYTAKDNGTTGENTTTGYASLTGFSGSSQPHNNLQPYMTCYMFKRTA